MTLILSCITKKYVVQVSDRRLSRGKIPVTDEANKAVLWRGLVSFAYTGVAELGPIMPGTPEVKDFGVKATPSMARTDVWLTQLIHNSDNLSEALKLMCLETAKELRRLKQEKQCHAYVGVGWGSFRATPDVLRPAIFVASNFLDSAGKLLHQFNPDLQSECLPLAPGKDYYWMSAGQPLVKKEVIELDRAVRRAIAKKRSPKTVAAILSHTVLNVSKRNKSVGNSLMVVILPKAACCSCTPSVG